MLSITGTITGTITTGAIPVHLGTGRAAFMKIASAEGVSTQTVPAFFWSSLRTAQQDRYYISGITTVEIVKIIASGWHEHEPVQPK